MGVRFARHFLHDGAANTLEEAIMLHAGEATRSQQRFARARPEEKAALIEFLNSL